MKYNKNKWYNVTGKEKTAIYNYIGYIIIIEYLTELFPLYFSLTLQGTNNKYSKFNSSPMLFA